MARKPGLDMLRHRALGYCDIYMCGSFPANIHQCGNESLTSLCQRLFCLFLRSICLTIISPMALADHPRETERGIAQSMPPLLNLS